MQHGAYLEITSKENEGSTFTAVFPKERLYRMVE
jgi:two-component system phosphate regulon sensor histidine kinase PhoR